MSERKRIEEIMAMENIEEVQVIMGEEGYNSIGLYALERYNQLSKRNYERSIDAKIKKCFALLALSGLGLIGLGLTYKALVQDENNTRNKEVIERMYDVAPEEVKESQVYIKELEERKTIPIVEETRTIPRVEIYEINKTQKIGRLVDENRVRGVKIENVLEGGDLRDFYGDANKNEIKMFPKIEKRIRERKMYSRKELESISDEELHVVNKTPLSYVYLRELTIEEQKNYEKHGFISPQKESK
jgi:hypothetical protein